MVQNSKISWIHDTFNPSLKSGAAAPNVTIIGWTDYTINGVHGCSKPPTVPREYLSIAELVSGPVAEKWFLDGTSPECIRCYAEHLSNKFGQTPQKWLTKYEEENVQLHPERLAAFGKLPWLARLKGTRRSTWPPVGDYLALPPSQRTKVFVASMGDIFHPRVPTDFLRRFFDIIAGQPYIVQLLTKRPDIAAKWEGPWPENIWLGTTCGHPMTKWRLEFLRKSKAMTRFVSMEPLLGDMTASVNAIDGRTYGLNLDGIHWVIVGGESGAGYRSMPMEWVRALRDQCVRDKVALFFKQDSAHQTERRCYLVETDGRAMQYRQFPGELTEPMEVEPDNTKYHKEHFPILQPDREVTNA